MNGRVCFFGNENYYEKMNGKKKCSIMLLFAWLGVIWSKAKRDIYINTYSIFVIKRSVKKLERSRYLKYVWSLVGPLVIQWEKKLNTNDPAKTPVIVYKILRHFLEHNQIRNDFGYSIFQQISLNSNIPLSSPV